MTLNSSFWLPFMFLTPFLLFSQEKQSGIILGYHHEIPATTFYSAGYFYEYHRLSGNIEIEIPSSNTILLNIGGKTSFIYSFLLGYHRFTAFSITSIEIQNIKLSPSNHKSYNAFGGYMGVGTEVKIHKQYSLLLQSLVGRRIIYYETPIYLWIPVFSVKLKYTLTN